MGPDQIQQLSEDVRTRVFLSYSRRDSALVQRVADGLTTAGFLADFDQAAHDPGNVSAGISAEDEWWKRLQEMIAAADVMVFLVSPDSSSSAVCDEEIAYARALGKRIIAVLARPVDFARAPPRLAALNVRIDFSEAGAGFDAALAALVSALEMNVGWHRDGRKYYARVQEWDTAGRPKSRLLREGAVEEAERWAVSRPRNEPEPGELFLAWIAASRTQIKRDAAVRAFWRRVTAFVVLLTFAITMTGAWIVVDQRRAVGRSESLMLARTSDQLFNQGDYRRALQVAILAARESFFKPSTDEAKAAFAKSAQALTHAVSIRPEDTFVLAAVSPDGKYIASWDASARINLWQTDPLKEISRRVHTVSSFGFVSGEFSPDGSKFLSFSLQAVQLQDTATGKDVGKPIALIAPIRFAKMSKDGQRFLTLDWEDGSARLFDMETAEPIGAPLSLLGGTAGAAFSDDSARVLTWGAQGGQVWSARTGEAEGALLATPGDVYDAVWSDDGAFAILLYDGKVGGEPQSAARIFNLSDGTARDLSDDGVDRAAFVSGMDRFVTWGSEPAARIWEVSTGQPVGDPIPQVASGGPPKISFTGRRLFASSYVTGPRLVDLDTGQTIADEGSLPAGTSGGAFSPDGNLLATWSGQTVVMVSAQTGSELDTRLMHDSEIRDVLFSEDNQLAFVTGSDKSQVYELATGIRLGQPLEQSQGLTEPRFLDEGRLIVTFARGAATISQTGLPMRVDGARFPEPSQSVVPESDAEIAPDGRTVITLAPDGTAQLWNAATRQRIGDVLRLPSSDNWTGRATFSADSQFVAYFEGNELQVYDAATGAPHGPMRTSYQDFGQAVITPGGERLVTWEGPDDVEVWDMAAEDSLATLAHDDVPFAVSPDGQRLMIWEGRTAQLIALKDGAVIGEPMPHKALNGGDHWIEGAGFSADGSRVLSYTMDMAQLWDSATAKPIGPPLSPLYDIEFAALSPDGKWSYVAFGSFATVHAAETGMMMGALHELSRGVQGAVFSADSRHIAAWTNDGRVTVRDVQSGTAIGEPIPVAMGVDGVKFSPDGARLLVWDQTGSVLVADARTGAVLARMSHHQAYAEPFWSDDLRSVRTLGMDGEVWVWDVSMAMAVDALPKDVSEVCERKLRSPPKADTDLPFIRLLDADTIFAAPILRGREGEDVCAPPDEPWWEMAAGFLFGWAFR